MYMRIPLFSQRGFMGSITKDQNCRYSLFLHEAVPGYDGCHYCRAMNSCLDDGFSHCDVCPLCVRNASDGGIACWYYDLSAGYSHSMLPDDIKRRTDGLIIAGLTGE